MTLNGLVEFRFWLCFLIHKTQKTKFEPITNSVSTKETKFCWCFLFVSSPFPLTRLVYELGVVQCSLLELEICSMKKISFYLAPAGFSRDLEKDVFMYQKIVFEINKIL